MIERLNPGTVPPGQQRPPAGPVVPPWLVVGNDGSVGGPGGADSVSHFGKARVGSGINGLAAASSTSGDQSQLSGWAAP